MGGNYTTKVHSDMMRARWQDPEYRAKMGRTISAGLTKRWQDPEYRAKMLAIIKAPEAIEQQRKANSATWTPERRKAFGDYISNRVRTDPGYAAKVRASAHKAMLASLAKRTNSAPEYLAKMTKEEREYYTFLTRRKKFTKAEALSMLGDQRRAARNQEAAD